MKIRRFIGTKDDAEEHNHGHLVDNEYIVNGYRIHHNSSAKACKSLCTAHNETVNVWSHMLGAVFYLVILLSLFWILAPAQMAVNSRLKSEFEIYPDRGCEITHLWDSSKLSCFLQNKAERYSQDVKALSVVDFLDQKSLTERVKELTDQAKGLAFFAMDRQRDFSYLVEQPST